MEISIRHLTKAYSGLPVLTDLFLELSSGSPYCLMSPSGSGKTTLLRLILGLEKPDEGEILGRDSGIFTAVFQENRLPEMFSPIEQLMMAAPKGYTAKMAREELLRILPPECLKRPVSTLSGGMKRRVSICRALAFPFDCCLMDEPFTGLDRETKHQVISYVMEKGAQKLLVIATHSEEETSLLKGRILHLPTSKAAPEP